MKEFCTKYYKCQEKKIVWNNWKLSTHSGYYSVFIPSLIALYFTTNGHHVRTNASMNAALCLTMLSHEINYHNSSPGIKEGTREE